MKDVNINILLHPKYSEIYAPKKGMVMGINDASGNTVANISAAFSAFLPDEIIFLAAIIPPAALIPCINL